MVTSHADKQYAIFFNLFGSKYMSDTNEQKNIRIKGSNNTIGNGNVVNSNNRKEETHIHSHHHHNSSQASGRDDAAGIGLGALAALVTTVWFFVKNAELVYQDLQLGSLFSIVPSLVALLIIMFVNRSDNKRIVAGVYGIVIGALGFVLSAYGQAQLPPDVLDFSHRAVNAWVFWKDLSHTQQNSVVGSLLGAIFVGGTVLFNCFMGIFVSIDALVDGNSGALLRLLNPFRPGRGGTASAVLLVISALFSSGIIFQFIDSLRASAS
ncbi:hypothetical protein JOE11_005282 [Robbsia andropogonis]|uniref:hypothetical protein n=1 Tax=Robbsia andropogonis TaxID=28092 RepID=UPI003D1AFB05